MRRRSFLRAVASFMPVVVIPESLVAQAPTPPGTGELHVVGSGEDRSGKSHSVGFSTILFKVTTAETQGRVFLMEHQQMKPNAGPNLHLHLNLDEWFYVMEGEVAFQVGEQRLHLHAGESVLGPRLVPHTFASVGPTPGRMLIGFSPAGNMEQFFIDGSDPNPPKRSPGFFETRDIGPSPFWKTT